jgi:hypothetical protein
VQFNDGGSALGGDADFTWDKNTNALYVAGKTGIGTSTFGTDNKLLVNAYGTADNDAVTMFTAGAADQTALTLQAAATPTAPLFKLQDSSGNTKASFIEATTASADYAMVLGTVADANLFTGSIAPGIWYLTSGTAGTTKYMIYGSANSENYDYFATSYIRQTYAGTLSGNASNTQLYGEAGFDYNNVDPTVKSYLMHNLACYSSDAGDNYAGQSILELTSQYGKSTSSIVLSEADTTAAAHNVIDFKLDSVSKFSVDNDGRASAGCFMSTPLDASSSAFIATAFTSQTGDLITAVGATGDLTYISTDGVVDTAERGIAWVEGGEHKWENYIWDSEEGEFLYTYQSDSDVDIMCISRGGRVGINKATNELLDHAFFTGTGPDDLIPGGLFAGAQQLWYQVAIDGTGSPNTFKWRTSTNGTSWGSYTTGVSITGAEQTLSDGVTITFGATTGHTLADQWDFVGFTQTPAGMLTVAPTRWKETWLYNGSTYESTLYALSSFQSGSTTLFSGTSHFHYFGYSTVFRSIDLNFSTFGAGVTLKVEYYDGDGWTEITSLSHRLVDQTSNCIQNGTIQWDRYLIADWVEYAVNGSTQFWVRVSTTTTPTVAPVVQTSSPSPVQKLAVYAGNLDTAPQFYVDGIGRIYGYTAKLAAQTVVPPYEEGTLYYNSNNPVKGMVLMTDSSSVPHVLGQEHLIRVYNDTGAQIDIMTAVYVSGVHTDGTPKIAKSKTDVASTSKCHGLAAHNISNSGYGYVVGFGMLTGVNTNSWNAGDRLYVSSATAGSITSTQPNIVLPIGIVVKKDSSAGSIYVRSNIAIGSGSISLTTGFLNASGTGGITGYVWDDANKSIYVRAGSSSNNAWYTGNSIASIILPQDFLSFPTNAFHASTQKSSEVTGNYIYAGVYKDNVADSSIDLDSGANLLPSSSGVWEDKTLSFGSTYSPGDNLVLQIQFYCYDNAPQQYLYLRGAYILYNKIV